MNQSAFSSYWIVVDNLLFLISDYQIEIINFFRFEGESDPDDNAILYVIETNDGVKGILIDAYGVYNSSKISQFLRNVEIVKKKNIKN